MSFKNKQVVILQRLFRDHKSIVFVLVLVERVISVSSVIVTVMVTVR